jgi:hypothetical protein
MVASHLPRLLPPIPPYLRLLILGCFIGALFYVPMFYQPPLPPAALSVMQPVEVAVPTLDDSIIALAKDSTREQRLLVEAEPLRHLLEKAIDVVPAVAVSLGMPEAPVPIEQLRESPNTWRAHWLWYKGELEDLSGPREGNPVKGFSIYEATVKLASGDRVLAAFSIPPGADVHRGGIVRVEGYLMKLRDTTYPNDITRAPMLVGRQIQRDYIDWEPVKTFDPELFANLDESCWPGTHAWATIDEDQSTPLWHLAAFARDTTDDRSFAEWRKIGTLNEPEIMPVLRANKFEHGTPLRVLGTLVKRQTIAADANPANIKFWTVVYVQVRDFGGHLIPVWIPKKVDNLKINASVEVRGFYYRWFAYEGLQGDRFRVPLFVAADLKEFDVDPSHAMRGVGAGLGVGITALILLFWWVQRSASKQSIEHDRDMDARRRRRREKRALAPAANPARPAP